MHVWCLRLGRGMLQLATSEAAEGVPSSGESSGLFGLNPLPVAPLAAWS